MGAVLPMFYGLCLPPVLDRMLVDLTKAAGWDYNGLPAPFMSGEFSAVEGRHWKVCCSVQSFQEYGTFFPKHRVLLLVGRGYDAPLEAVSAGMEYLQCPFVFSQGVEFLTRLAIARDVHGSGAFSHFSVLVREQCVRDQLSGKEVSVTVREGEVMGYLLACSRSSREDMMHALWGYVEGVETQTLETHLSRLRGKLAPLGLGIANQNGYISLYFP